MKQILTTVGTSLFTNAGLSTAEFDANVFSLKAFNENSPIYGIIENAENRLRNHIDNNPTGACAELNCIRKIDPNGDAQIHLICTATLSSYMCGRVLKRHFGDRATLQYVEGLQVRDANTFQETGFLNLIETVKNLCTTHEGEKIFNISGGYKAIIPAMTLLAQLEKASIHYIFEESNEVIAIAPLPMSYDWDVIEALSIYLHNDNKRNDAPEVITKQLRTLHLMKPDSCALTVVGNLVKQYSIRASPYTGTIFGYFIEYKFHEAYSKWYGADKVWHSVPAGKGSEDMDLLIQNTDGNLIAVEIKPAARLQDEQQMEAIKTKMVRRVNHILESETYRGKKIGEIWLLVYTLADENTQLGARALTGEEQTYANTLAEDFRDNLDNKPVFRIKHFLVKRNNLSGERHVYQRFMKSELKEGEIKEIFSSGEQH